MLSNPCRIPPQPNVRSMRFVSKDVTQGWKKTCKKHGHDTLYPLTTGSTQRCCAGRSRCRRWRTAAASRCRSWVRRGVCRQGSICGRRRSSSSRRRRRIRAWIAAGVRAVEGTALLRRRATISLVGTASVATGQAATAAIGQALVVAGRTVVPWVAYADGFAAGAGRARFYRGQAADESVVAAIAAGCE